MANVELELFKLKEKVDLQNILADRMSGISFENYLKYVAINSSPEPKKFADLAEDWQWDQARTVGPAIEAVMGLRPTYRGKRAFWRTMPRGHDKSSSIARLMNYALCYSRKSISAVVAASDRDQAAFITDFMEAEARLNPWFKNKLQFKVGKVEGTNNSNLKVLAADAFGSFGLTNDIIICDELTHWANEKLWNTLISGSNKRIASVIIIITNAGTMGTWQWKIREVARTDKTWHFYEAPGPMAKWMDSPRVASMRLMMPPSEAKRVLDNQWVDPSEDAGYVSRAEAMSCEERGIEMGLSEQFVGQPDREYFAGVDYGPKKDRTVLTVGHRRNNMFVVDQMVVLQGKDYPGKYVPVLDVENWMRRINKSFPNCTFVVDMYQMEGSVQALSGIATIERFEPRGGKANYEMASIMRSAIVNGRLAWYPNCGSLTAQNDAGVYRQHTLIDEFAESIIQPTSAGYRLQHLSNGHDDRLCSLGMAVWRALGGFRKRPFQYDDRFF